MSPDDAVAALNHIDQLNRFARASHLMHNDNLDADNFDIWIEEVVALLKKHFGGNRALLDAASKLSHPSPHAKRREKALDLLETAKALVFVDPAAPPFEPLQSLVEHVIRERYLKSWEFRALAGAFAFVTVLFFGGTLYLGYQVHGVSDQADAARVSIRAAADSVDKMRGDILADISAEANARARDSVTKFNHALRDSEAAVARQNARLLNLQLQQFRSGQNRVSSAINDQVTKAGGFADAYWKTAKPAIDRRIDQSVGAASGAAIRSIKADADHVNGVRAGFDASLPASTRLANQSARQFNEIVSRYSPHIEEILRALPGTKSLTSLQIVAQILGVSLWVLALTFAGSCIALVIAGWAWLRTIRFAKI